MIDGEAAVANWKKRQMSEANKTQVGGAHYKAPVQHWDFVLMHAMPYMEAQIFKYVLRWRKKNGVEDLRKARHFINKLIEWEEAHGPDLGAPGDNDYMNPDSGVPGSRYVNQD